MHLFKNKLYIILTGLCIAGYIWLFYNILNISDEGEVFNVCIIKHVANIPCPSCGSTRSIVSLLKGNIAEALYWNPLGLVIVLIMIGLPIWIIYDLIRNDDSLIRFYNSFETTLKKPKVASAGIVLILINWIWNILKGL
ncbi:MAG: hypothetical protein A2W99_13155 [Bacteroidetes bacterium GWF2_33_16]|nr:MAG: hypothetical protein A2X00_01120 [Bacteroidetes bacterium GWE2_32_14]OFY06627.1 MAG: hypothetical protein A2W99_13155 [Bacteroidetes bacterium GWF2_33_16]